MRHILSLLVVLIAAGPAAGAERQVIKTDWNDLRTQITSRNLTGRNARIALSTGITIKSRILDVTDSALVVREAKATTAWKTDGKTAQIPRDLIKSIRFSGKMGHRALCGTLIGIAAGAALFAVALPVSGACYDAVACAVAGVALPAGAIAGYFIGRAAATPAPEFVLKP